MEGRLSHPYRVFISFAHKDADKASRVASYLKSIGAEPFYDAGVHAGLDFDDQIQERIRRCHLMIWLLTPNSEKSSWVLQEVGFALGHAVPIIPLTDSKKPSGMAARLQAITVNPTYGDLESRLTPSEIEIRMALARRRTEGTYHCASTPLDRHQMLSSFANELLIEKKPGMVRQMAALTSFSIPNAPEEDPIWSRYGADRGPNVRAALQKEREFLEAHALNAGCRLMADPFVEVRGDVTSKHSPEVSRFRLELLLEFLSTRSPNDTEVVISRGRINKNVTAIGDWFISEAVVPFNLKGYQLTLFTWHGPTVLSKIKDFDSAFESLLRAEKLSARSSLQVAKDEIHKAILAI